MERKTMIFEIILSYILGLISAVMYLKFVNERYEGE
jgi:hypothetical protein